MSDVIVTVFQPSPVLVEVKQVGLQGPPGPAGVAGQYVHTQSVASPIWTVNHNTGRRPVVTILTVGGIEMFGQVVHVDSNQLQCLFDQAESGTAICI